MKYFEFTFHTSPCTETVNDVLTAVLGEVGFESFVESEGGLTAYIQQSVCDENAIKTVIAEFPLSDTEITYTFTEAEDKDWNEEWEKKFLPTDYYWRPLCNPQYFSPECTQSGI